MTVRGLSGFQAEFVGFLSLPDKMLTQWNQRITCDLSGLSGFVKEESTSRKSASRIQPIISGFSLMIWRRD